MPIFVVPLPTRGHSPAMPPAAQQVVQFAVDSLLDGRPVTTLSAGALVPWTVGIDKDDGYITTAAAKFLKQTDKALPDDATFAADATHPDIVLHFSNSASSTSPQARGVSGVAGFELEVPRASYSELYLAVTSSYGDSPLTATLAYADNSTSKVQFTLPDWGTGSALPTSPPIFFNLISGLHKWTHANASVDTPTHTITGVELTPEPNKELTRIRIDKAGANSYLVFWGATGVATSPIGNSNGGASGSGGMSGSAGAAGSEAGQGGTPSGGSGASGAAGSSAAGAGGTPVNAQAGAPGGTGGGAGSLLAGMSAGGASELAPAANDTGGCSLSRRRASSFGNALSLLAFLLLLGVRRLNSSR